MEPTRTTTQNKEKSYKYFFILHAFVYLIKKKENMKTNINTNK